jgi:hypothetical protein
MNLSETILKMGHLTAPSVPELRYLAAAAQKVRDRWPDADPPKNEREREALALKLRDKVERNAWDKTRLSFVVTAASAVFDPERRDRPDLSRTRDFLYAEVDASTSETFLSGMLRIYLESYVPSGVHTVALATGLRAATLRMGAAGRLLLEGVPELMDSKTGPNQLASRMSRMSDPYVELTRLGLRNPHSAGFMDLAHLSLTEQVRPHLSERNLIDWYIRWLRPPGKEEARNAGAERAIEALIHPWIDIPPEDKLRSYLVETLIELYGDPRIKSGGAWSGIGERHLSVIHRWLTREDMRFFTRVVDAAQSDPMWPPRRDFWLKLYDEGRIDAAWAALSSQAFEYARQHLMRQDAKNAYTRVGFQKARQNTSLLILKIGNKIMVDGCHSYRTHVFDIGDPMAPKLFQEGYDCQEIMDASDRRLHVAAKSHSSIDSWGRWVRDMINADVSRSQRTRPYSKVFRPRPPQPRYAPPPRPVAPAYPVRRPAWSGSGQEENRSATSRTNAPPSASTGATGQPTQSKPATTGPTIPPSVSLKGTKFPSLVDRMIAYGPSAASAVLTYLEGPGAGRDGASLSPKSREGLAWVLTEKVPPPLHLRNALEYLLNNLEKRGVDLDNLFLRTSGRSGPGPLFDHPETPLKTTADSDPIVPREQYPPIPKSAEGRLHHLLGHVDAIEEIGMGQAKFEQRRAASLAVGKLRERRSDLLPSEITDLIILYEKLRQRNNGGLK